MSYIHVPVLLNEVIDLLSPKKGGVYMDATLGGGGYTSNIAGQVGEEGKVLAIDADTAAIENFRQKFPLKQVVLKHGNFVHAKLFAEQEGLNKFDGVVADLGLSSYDLDASGRGFSFQRDESLDMRFDSSKGESAEEFLANAEMKDIEKVIREYGEEKFAAKIARVIVEERRLRPLRTTFQLVDLIKRSLPKPLQHKVMDSARRVFQALRIHVNQELESLESFLPQAFDLLESGGVLVIVSFHSLEDRIVKNYFKELLGKCKCPPDFPICVCGNPKLATELTKKPVVASNDEQNKNPRSKSAKLRAIKKI